MVTEREDRAWQAMHDRLRPRVRGDEKSRLQNLMINQIQWRDGHWVWTGYLHSRAGTPEFSFVRIGTYNPKTKNNKKSKSSAFNLMMRLWFPEQNVRPHQKFQRMCDEPRCISPYHRMHSLDQSSRRMITYEQAVRLYQAPPGKPDARQIAAELGLTYRHAQRVRTGNVYRDWYARFHGVEPVKPWYVEFDHVNALAEKRRKARRVSSGSSPYRGSLRAVPRQPQRHDAG
jgi:hypothetical protein